MTFPHIRGAAVLAALALAGCASQRDADLFACRFHANKVRDSSAAVLAGGALGAAGGLVAYQLAPGPSVESMVAECMTARGY
jgi:hypothetical protein